MEVKLNVREGNQDLAAEVKAAAAAKGLGITRFQTGRGGWSGVHRYVAYVEPDRGRPNNYNDKRVTAYFEAAFGRTYQPSIKQEAACLRSLLAAIQRYEVK